MFANWSVVPLERFLACSCEPWRQLRALYFSSQRQCNAMFYLLIYIRRCRRNPSRITQDVGHAEEHNTVNAQNYSYQGTNVSVLIWSSGITKVFERNQLICLQRIRYHEWLKNILSSVLSHILNSWRFTNHSVMECIDFDEQKSNLIWGEIYILSWKDMIRIFMAMESGWCEWFCVSWYKQPSLYQQKSWKHV